MLSPISWATAHCSRSGRSAGPTTIVPCSVCAADRVGEADEAAADRHGFILGDDQTDALGEEGCVDRRVGDAGFPENVGGAVVDGGGEFFGGDFGEHGWGEVKGRRPEVRVELHGEVCICIFVHYL